MRLTRLIISEVALRGKVIKLNGICKDLENLTGASFTFIPALKEIGLPLCSEEKICKAKDFYKQRVFCRDLEAVTVDKFKKSSIFKICRFRCGLSEFILPVYNGGNLRGIVLTNKIKEKNNSPDTARDANPPCLNSKQINSLASLLNYCGAQFKEIIASRQDLVPNTRDKILINRARHFIEEKYHHLRLPLKDVAKEINTSYFYLCRLFKKELNLTFVQYLTLVRLKASLKLLQNLNLTVAQVSYAVGFADAQYFDRIFKKFLNCRPKDYRFSSSAKKEKIRQKVLSALC
ncbi:MAG: AraC family transcriptional regulator [Candidatus Omnitrophota bacterium]